MSGAFVANQTTAVAMCFLLELGKSLIIMTLWAFYLHFLSLFKWLWLILISILATFASIPISDCNYCQSNFLCKLHRAILYITAVREVYLPLWVAVILGTADAGVMRQTLTEQYCKASQHGLPAWDGTRNMNSGCRTLNFEWQKSSNFGWLWKTPILAQFHKS